MALDAWFPLAIYHEDLPDASAHNRFLLDQIYRLRSQASPLRTNAQSSWTGDVHDVDRLHLDPAFDWLTDTVGVHAVQYLKALGHNLSITDIYIQRSWPVVTGRGQSVARHAHHTAHLSAVYYVAAPREGDGGQIRFMNDHRPNELFSGVNSDMTKGYAEFNSLNFNSALYRPVPGRLLLFPAKLTHMVEPNQTGEDRVSISYDLVVTSRGAREDGHYEFLMPPPSVWRRVGRSEPAMAAAPQPAPALRSGRTPLSAVTGRIEPRDAFSIPDCEGHLLWEPTLLADCASNAARRACATVIAEAVATEWLRDDSGTVRLLTECETWPVFRDAVERVLAHLRYRDVPLDSANIIAPVLQWRETDAAAPFRRGRAHLCAYLRLDSGPGHCSLQLEEGGEASLPPGGLMLIGGARRHRIVGAGQILHFQLDLPAIARSDALNVRGLQVDGVEDYTVFAALCAQPIYLALPTGTVLLDKIAWLQRRARRRYRQDACPITRRFILEHADPATAAPEEIATIQGYGLGAQDAGRLMRVDAALSLEECERLRAHTEAHVTSVAPDSVDDLPEYQVNLTTVELQDLLGATRADSILRLPDVLEAGVVAQAQRLEIFLRKYSAETRPYITFHADTCRFTVNIALSGDSEVEGGRLLAIEDGRLKPVERAAGAAVLHAGDVVHGVTRVERGVRYSLIVFYY